MREGAEGADGMQEGHCTEQGWRARGHYARQEEGRELQRELGGAVAADGRERSRGQGCALVHVGTKAID